MEWLGHRVGSVFTFCRNLHTAFHTTPKSVRGFSLCLILASAHLDCLLSSSHSDGCAVASASSFGVHFPGVEWGWASFQVSVDHLCVLFGEMSIQVLCPLYNWIFKCWIIWVIYGFGILTLCQRSPLKIHLPLCSLPFNYVHDFLRGAKPLAVWCSLIWLFLLLLPLLEEADLKRHF